MCIDEKLTIYKTDEAIGRRYVYRTKALVGLDGRQLLDEQNGCAVVDHDLSKTQLAQTGEEEGSAHLVGLLHDVED